MFIKEKHISTNDKINLLKDLFPDKILRLIEYFIIKNYRKYLHENIYSLAKKFKNNRDILENNYLFEKNHMEWVTNINNFTRQQAMIKEGIDPNIKIVYPPPIHRQMGSSKTPLWWTS
jgi:hypothetical protein